MRNSKTRSQKHFTVGINDDITHTSLPFDPGFVIEPEGQTRAVSGDWDLTEPWVLTRIRLKLSEMIQRPGFKVFCV